jgi:hypothetical protein
MGVSCSQNGSKSALGRPWRRWEDNNTKDLKEIEGERATTTWLLSVDNAGVDRSRWK